MTDRVALFWHLTTAGLAEVPPGVAVACFEGDADALERAGAEPIGWLAFPQEGAAIEHERLLSFTDAVVDALARQGPLGRWLERLYGTPDVRCASGRALLWSVDWLTALGIVVARRLEGYDEVLLTPDWPDSLSHGVVLRALEIPDVRAAALREFGPELVAAVDRVGYLRARSPSAVHRLATSLRAVVAPWWHVLRIVRAGSTRFPSSRLVLRTYPTDWESVAKSTRLRRVDFVVDGVELRPTEVLVWADTGVPDDRKKNLEARGYTVVGRDDLRIGFIAFMRRAFPILLRATCLLPALVRSDRWWDRHLPLMVIERIYWRELAAALGATRFLSYNDLSTWGIARDLVLKRNGIPSIAYQHSAASYSEIDVEWRAAMPCAYFASSAIAAWGPMFARQYEISHGAVDETWDVGCLWSELARTISEEPLRSRYAALLEPWLPAPLDAFERRVSLIDFTITNEVSCHAWIETHRLVDELAAELPSVLFLVKPKRAFSDVAPLVGEEGRRVMDELGSRPNVAIVPFEYETSAIVAFSDVVVGMPYTSVAIEAIGAGRRAVYFDPCDVFPVARWRGVPGMVVTDLHGLRGRLRELLWVTTDDEWADWVQSHLPDVATHLDGLAITRLRRRLLALGGSG